MSGDIQFEKAQFASGDHCVVCQNPLERTYFRLNGNTVCSSCAEKAKFDYQLHQSQSGGLARAVLFGLGAAVAGAIIYGLIAVLTGYEFALIAILIGWIVGKAMVRGSRGKGGRRFQVAAVVITYLSITAGYIPGIIKELAKIDSSANKEGSGADKTESKNPATPPEDKKDVPPMTAGGFVIGVGVMLGIAAIAPLLNLTAGVSGLIGIVIIAFGLMQAWKETRGQPFAISGPFRYESKQAENNAAPA